MLGLFSTHRSDHPFADPRRLEERLRLLPRDPAAAVEEGTELLAAIAAAEIPAARRIEAAALVDATIQPLVRKLMREFAARSEDCAQTERLWIVVRRFWHQSADFPSGLIEAQLRGDKHADAVRREQPTLAVRAARAWSELGRWCHLTYGPHEPMLWPRLAAIYRTALDRGYLETRCTPQPRIAFSTSVENEVLRLAVFWSSAPARLGARRIDCLDRIVASLAPHFEMSAAQRPEAIALFDPHSGRAPGRHGQSAAAGPGARFLSGHGVLPIIDRMLGAIARDNALPAELDAVAGFSTVDVAQTLRHLHDQWSQPLRTRRHVRHPLASTVAVVHGLDGLLRALGRNEGELDFAGADAPATWRTVDVSAGGLAAISQGGDAELAIDALKAVRPQQSTRWQAVLVRRIERLASGEANVALESIGIAAHAASIAVIVDGGEATHRVHAVLLTDPAHGEAALRLLLPAGVHANGNAYRTDALPRGAALLRPRTLVAQGPGYELIDCSVHPAA